jgi:hypothetical protein
MNPSPRWFCHSDTVDDDLVELLVVTMLVRLCINID